MNEVAIFQWSIWDPECEPNAEDCAPSYDVVHMYMINTSPEYKPKDGAQVGTA